jgi:thiamine pyrophosphate-dependent acetolactate synthase large subunit-like protein
VGYHGACHEASAVAMADGYARVAGSVGVATAHQGPGLTNALTALTEAVRSRTPLVLLAAESGSGNQALDQVAVTRSLGALALHGAPQMPPSADAPAAPAPHQIEQITGALAAASRPVILAGRGALGAGCELGRLAEAAGALLATTAAAHGLFAGNPRSLGIAGGFASQIARRLLREADLLLVFGASLNRWTTDDVVVVNDRGYGAEVHDFEPLGVDVELARFPDLDLAAVARGLGAGGATVRCREDLAVLADWIARPEVPLVLDCKVNPDVAANW